jgi:uncharacterized membrane protein
MGEGIVAALIVLAALGSGLIAGAFFAFSSFVMGALARLPPAQGVAAMNSINLVVLNRSFLGVFFGTAALCVLLAIAALAGATGGRAPWLLAGAALYLVGSIGVTMACNVPRNVALAKLDPAACEAAAAWSRYVAEWTGWNHARTAASLAAAALFVLALR